VKITRANRLIRLLVLLQSGRRLDVEGLTRDLGVSRRTVFRDLEALIQAGVPCFYDHQEGTYRVDRSFFLPPVHFTLAEALAILLAARRFIPRQVAPDYEAALTAAGKLETLLPQSIQTQCGSYLDSIEVKWAPTVPADAVSSLFDTIQRALHARRKLRLTYDSFYEGGEIQTVLHPYRIVFVTRAWYVIGYSERHEEVRTFKFDRVVGTETLDAAYEGAEAFSLKDYFGNAWRMIRGDQRHHVRIRFSPKVAGNVEEVIWHSTQQTKNLPDGSLLFEVDVDGVDEMSWWVLGYGKEAVVEEPAALRALIQSHAQAVLEHYAS
jgi:predicted DNA-binding transcriptional regulator YafY